MATYIPLKSSTSDFPVFHVDTQVPLEQLLDYASRRVHAARDLVQTLSCVRLLDTDDRDLTILSNALYHLLDEGSEVLALVQQRMLPPR